MTSLSCSFVRSFVVMEPMTLSLCSQWRKKGPRQFLSLSCHINMWQLQMTREVRTSLASFNLWNALGSHYHTKFTKETKTRNVSLY